MLARLCLFALFAALMACTAVDSNKAPPSAFEVKSKITLAEGQREAFIEILKTGTRDMPGNIAYDITKDSADENLIWVSELWEDEAAHKASLALPSVREAIAQGRPMIRAMERVE